MRIFVIGKDNFLNWDLHVVSAFKNLGHQVEHFQINNRPWNIQFSRGILKGLLGKNRGNKISNGMFINILKRRLESFKPDLIFFTSACFIPVEFYEVVNSLSFKPKIFAWEGDGGTNNLSNSSIRTFVDVMFESENEYVKSNILEFKNIFNLPFCANINIYKKYDLKRENKFYFCGSWTEDRDEIFSQLTDYDIVFRGWKWDKLSSSSEKFDIKLGTISVEEQINDYNRYYTVINKHQASNNPLSALNMRTFEVPACNTLLVNDYRKGIENYFDLDNEICTYKDILELKDILEKIKKEPNSFDKIRENGYKRVLNEHTYEHRMKSVIKIYNEL